MGAAGRKGWYLKGSSLCVTSLLQGIPSAVGVVNLFSWEQIQLVPSLWRSL